MKNTTSIGAEGESTVSQHLRNEGHKIIDRNWKTKWCEVDLITQKDERIYFVEVKFRSSSRYGSGLDYITPTKQKQMRFAAELWIQSHDWHGDAMLLAAEVGPDREVHVVEVL